MKDSKTEYVVKPEKPLWLRLVRARSTEYEHKVLQAAPVISAEVVVDLLRNRLREEIVEVVWVIALNSQRRPQFIAEVARGTLDGAAFGASDVMRLLFCSDASGFVMVHNHPSGDPTPSKEDLVSTHRLQLVAAMTGITMVDHVVATSDLKFVSMFSMFMMLSKEEVEKRLERLK